LGLLAYWDEGYQRELGMFKSVTGNTVEQRRPALFLGHERRDAHACEKVLAYIPMKVDVLPMSRSRTSYVYFLQYA
jgi:hypothetical protein